MAAVVVRRLVIERWVTTELLVSKGLVHWNSGKVVAFIGSRLLEDRSDLLHVMTWREGMVSPSAIPPTLLQDCWLSRSRVSGMVGSIGCLCLE